MIAKNTHLSLISRSRAFRRGASLGLCLAVTSCVQTQHEVITAKLGSVSSVSDGSKTQNQEGSAWLRWEAQLDTPGPIGFEKFVAADWAVDRSGLLNLDHDKARAAGLQDGPEAIQVYFYVIEHPIHGAFMIDSGIARSIAERADNMPVAWPVSAALPTDELKVRLDTRTYLEQRSTGLAGVFLTHLHLDHILGLQDFPKTVPLYIGPGEADDRRWSHGLVRRTTDLNLAGFGPLRQWQVLRDPHAPFAYVDIFGDQSVMGLHTPGHTDGNMAFVIRSQDGLQLLVGDASHTRWGWEHNVEPGEFNTDGDTAALSLDKLRRFARQYPLMTVHLGHQHIGDSDLGRGPTTARRSQDALL